MLSLFFYLFCIVKKNEFLKVVNWDGWILGQMSLFWTLYTKLPLILACFQEPKQAICGWFCCFFFHAHYTKIPIACVILISKLSQVKHFQKVFGYLLELQRKSRIYCGVLIFLFRIQNLTLFAGHSWLNHEK